ncbi:flagellar hook assembly protein FlgD [Massilia sp. S19_KUP03_FR1]|uniref:flagellar hook assembly protein FlgD n=1 Tax=Massilia sp. S19_KUP03_FR1 TaxID=3025503 RepID=UPI002FCD9CE7
MTTVTSNTSATMTDLMSTMNNKPAAAAEGSVEADTNKFLTLLVTQLKNQDPMNPLDNAQLTSQLAQLSTVTGVNKLNTTLESLKSSYQSSEAMSATNMIGHGVFVDGSFVNVASGQSILGANLGSAAEDVKVIVTDPATGKDIKTIELGAQPAGILPITWDGKADGATASVKDGKYSFRVVATRAGTQLTDATALAFDSVASVSTSATDGVKLNLPTKGQVTLADIKQVM